MSTVRAMEPASREMQVLLVTTILMAGTLPACSPPSNYADAEIRQDTLEARRNGNAMPAIYVDRIVEDLNEGRNDLREGYRRMLSACEDAGKPTTPLTAEQEALIYTTRVQLWIAPDKVAARKERWEADMAGDLVNGCHFVVVSSGEHTYWDRERTISIDLATNEEAVLEADPDPFERYPQETPSARVKEGAAEGGKPFMRIVAGQPCLQWRDARARSACVWSGGLKWGFSADQHYVERGLPPDLHQIVLAQGSSNRSGTQVITKRFSLGAQLDPAAMMPVSATRQTWKAP